MQKFRKINGIIVLVTHDEREIEESSRCFELADGVLKEAFFADECQSKALSMSRCKNGHPTVF